AQSGPRQGTALAPLPVGRWPHAWATLLGNAWKTWVSNPRSAVLLAPALIGAALHAAPSCRESARRALLPPAVLISAAVIYFIEVGTLRWVHTNLYAVRYLYPSFMMFHAALATLAAVTASALLGRWAGPLVRWGSLPLLCAGAITAFGKPSVAAARADLD